MSFAARSSKGAHLENMVFSDLQKAGFHVAVNGTEHTHPNFVRMITRSEDATSLMIRFQPDGVISYGKEYKSAYIEVKASPFIEKLAYTNYKRISDGGALVILVSQNNAEIKFIDIKNLKFKTIRNNRNNFPIIDGWVCPRKHKDWHRIKSSGFRGSGTPYRLIDHSKMISWNRFKIWIETR